MGFLPYNFAPARIFMGDGGSQFLGYTLAVISVRAAQNGAAGVAILVPLSCLGLPILDLVTTVARRAFRQDESGANGVAALVRRVSRADREHLHHNLLELGLSHRSAVLALYLLAALLALSGYLFLVPAILPLALCPLILSVGSVVFIKLALAGARARVRARHAGGGTPS